MTTEIRLLGLDEYPAIASFIDQNWKKDHAYTRSKDLFNWTFRDSPVWNEQDCYSIAVAADGGSIFGMLGAIPFKLNDHGKTLKACWLVNWVVMPEVRGGKGLALLNLFSKERGFNTISFGINDAVARLYTALQWQEMPPIPRMEWVNPAKVDAAEALLGMMNPAASAEQIQKYISKASSATLANDQPEASPLNTVDASEWDRKGWGVWSEKTIGCARDYSYLTWRYLQHPIYKYETRVIAEDEKLGLIVWRIETTLKANSKGKLVAYVPFGRIVEFLPTSEANARELMSRCLIEVSAVGALAADFYCYNIELIGILQRIGFSISDNASYVHLPNHTQPIARGSNIRSTIKTFAREEITAQDAEWYWTRSDSDQDRPS